MFKRVTIKAQLFALAAFISVLMSVVGFIGLNSTQKANEALIKVYQDRVIPITRLKVIGDAYTTGISDSLNKVINKIIKPEDAEVNIEHAVNTILREWQQYSHSSQGKRLEDEQAGMLELENLMFQADNAISDVKGILATNDIPKLSQYMASTVYPLLEPISKSISKLIDLQLSQVKSEYEAANAEFMLQRKIAIVTILCGIILTFFASFGLARTISKSLKEVSSQLDSIASGQADLTKRIKILRRNEVGEVSTNFNRFMENLLTLVKRVQKSGIQVTSSATAIAATSKQLERTINDFGSFTNEVGATAKEISATSQELVKTMSEVSTVATNTANLATEGQNNLGRMESTMSQMEDASTQISSRLAIISEKAANITNVVTTITKIADQTNLLSLNASIEAEKAGEYGLGFAVVAREIRRLADQVALATLDIDQMVKEMKSAVSAGVMEMDKFSEEVHRDVQDVRSIGSQLTQIIEQVQTLLPRFESVHEGVHAQAEGAQQISESMIQLSEAVKQTDKSLAETSRVVIELNQAAKDLQTQVSGFRVDQIDVAKAAPVKKG